MAKITLNNIRPLVPKFSDELMPGVRRSANCKHRYQAWISISGTQRYLGSFDSNLEAGIAWLEAKVKRDSVYLEEFKINLANEKDKLKKLKLSQANAYRPKRKSKVAA